MLDLDDFAQILILDGLNFEASKLDKMTAPHRLSFTLLSVGACEKNLRYDKVQTAFR
jgi:hypothetical protein